MTTRTKLTHKTLALQARKLSGDIDGARWALAELAAQAQAEGVPGWAEIIGAECKRQPDTVEKWAHTWKWAGDNRVGGYVDTGKLPYSFFECAAKKADRLSLDTLIELLQTYERQPGTTYESFRAQLSTMTGGDGSARAQSMICEAWARGAAFLAFFASAMALYKSNST